MTRDKRFWSSLFEFEHWAYYYSTRTGANQRHFCQWSLFNEK